MEIADQILKHPRYIAYMNFNAEAEKDRIYCKHNLQHVLDVARVSYIISLEKGLLIPKELIYAAALLHDIAKWKQYRDGTDHAEEGAKLAKEILRDCGISGKDAEEIMDAIKTHRRRDTKKSPLGTVLYEGDKACRPCVCCKSMDSCNRFLNGEEPVFKY